MNEGRLITRRRMLKSAMAGASGVTAGTLLQTPSGAATFKAPAAQVPVKQRCPDAPRVRGPFPILSTPFTDSGAVDFEVLAREARFADWCGSPGMIWPQSNDSIDLLTRDEKLKGMEVLAKTARDALMQDYDTQYPGYDFAAHKGYATSAHRDAIRKLGPSPIHRRSFTLLPQPRLFD